MQLLKKINIRVVLILGLIAIITSCATKLPSNSLDDVCVIYKKKRQWKKSVVKNHKKWGVPPHTIMAMIHQESRFNPRARPIKKTFWGKKRVSTAYGYSQALDGTWKRYQKAVGEKSAKRTNFKDSVDFIGWYIDANYKRNRIAKHDTYNQYLAYHEGMGGFQRGTHHQKPWLKDVARKVQRRSEMYKRQGINC